MIIPEECQSCHGAGTIDIGDCEDGVTVECQACEGTGQGTNELDEFIPARDAFVPGD